MTTWTIHQGNALDVLRGMPDESVQCSITSPPYYGLRSYKTEPQIWDGDEFCDHEWGVTVPFAKQDTRTVEQKIAQGATVGSNQQFNDENTAGNSGCFCRCGAWRGELGLEPTFQLYLSHLLQIFAEVKRVVKADGTIWINLGDSYATHAGGIVKDPMRASTLAGTKSQMEGRLASAIGQYKKGGHLPEKSLMNIPHRFFIMLTDELGLIQRNNINWWKRACMPSSAKDRFTVDFESIGFFTKNARYKFNQVLEPLNLATIERAKYHWANPDSKAANYESQNGLNRDSEYPINLEGRNCRTTWDFGFEPSSNEHYAAYPSKMCDRMILAGSDEGDTVLDIFSGTASTGLSALRLKRNFVGIELNPDYIKIAEKRLAEVQVKLF